MRPTSLQRVALVGLCLLLISSGGPITIGLAAEPSFSDVDPNSTSPYAIAIYELARLGIVRGYNDGTGRFGPLDPVLRVQSAAIIVRALGWTNEQGQANFTDQGSVDDELWNSVRVLADHDVAHGFGDGTYHPLEVVAQVQIVSLITRAMVNAGYWQRQGDNAGLFPDVPESSGARSDIATYNFYTGEIAFATGGAQGGWTAWAGPANRQEVALVIWNALKKKSGASPSAKPAPSPPAASPSSAPSPSMPGTGGVGVCGEDLDHWHPPVVGGCATGHEHGDAPPAWVLTSRWMPMFTHPGNTPSENVLKHTSFKGFALREDNVDLYVLMHLDTNPNGNTSRFHSYQVWARDATGAVSHWDLWADFGSGNETGPHLQAPDNCGNDGSRPIMMVNYASGCPGVVFENWYSRAGAPGWGWDLGFNVQPQYYGGPSKGVNTNGDLANRANWLPTGQLNGTRRLELAWYANRGGPRGDFWSTQWGDVVSGPADARCGQARTFGTKSYTTLCIQQSIAPTLTTVQFPGNAIQKDYDVTGVTLPN